MEFVEDGGEFGFELGEAGGDGGDGGEFADGSEFGGRRVFVVVEVDEERASQVAAGFEAGAEAFGDGVGEEGGFGVREVVGGFVAEECGVDFDEDGDALVEAGGEVVE